jgi:arylsulfatase A-like enzyme
VAHRITRALAFATAVAATAVLATWLEHESARFAPAAVWWRIGAANTAVASVAALAFLALARARGWRRRAPGLLAIAGLLLATVPWNVRGPGPVVWVVSDTLRADFLSLYGYERETSPFLEGWADEIVVFDDAYSQGSHTIVSAPAILASLYPSTHGLQDYRDVLDERAILVSELLRERGYATFGAVTNPHLGPRNGFDQGYDRYHHPGGWSNLASGRVNDLFFAWRREVEPGARYFTLLWYIDPHTPFQWDDEAAAWAGLDPEESFSFKPEHKDEAASPELRRRTRRRYEAAVRSVDHSLAEVVGFLREVGDYDDTLIVFTSDHGESMWEHGRYGHDYGLYEHLTHVPLVIRFPPPLHFPAFAAGGERIDAVVSSVDILPTTMAALGFGADAVESSQGRSFLPVLDARESGAAYLEQRLTQYGPYQVFGLRDGRFKFIREDVFEDATTPREMLYDLTLDPGEQVDLSADRPDLVESYRARVEALRSRYEALALPTRRAEPDRETLELLRSLGYAEDGPAAGRGEQ